MNKNLFNKLFLLISILLIAAQLCAAPSSTIRNYSQKELPFKPSAMEQGFYKQLRDHASKHKYKLELDPYLSIAAIIYAKEIGSKRLQMSAALLDYALFQAGSIEANVFPYLLKFSTKEQYTKLLPDILRTFIDQNADNCGFGFYENKQEQNYILVILGSKKSLEIKPFPRHLTKQGYADLQGSLLKNYAELKLVITLPQGRIATYRPASEGKNFFINVPLNQGNGKYQLELTGETESGPEILALFPVYVGILPPSRPRKEVYKDPKIYNSAFEAEKVMFNLANQERAKAGLDPLTLSSRASDVARLYSQEMVDQRFFAHISPLTGSNVVQRLKKDADISATKTGENLAVNDTLLGAHKNLMASPAHRANILDPDFTHAGIGIAFKADHQGRRSYYITEDFFSQFQDLDLESFKKLILEKLNKKRQELGLSALDENEGLDDLANEHSKEMAQKDDLSFSVSGQHLFQKIRKAGIAFKYLSANIFAFNDPTYNKYIQSPELEQTQFKEVGIGLIQSNSKEFGRKTVWLTLIFAE